MVIKLVTRCGCDKLIDIDADIDNVPNVWKVPLKNNDKNMMDFESRTFVYSGEKNGEYRVYNEEKSSFE